ncbi:MAG: dihydrodipicolinate synthase family protein [Hungatella sp.]|nr:dihydrodipicolinate synthase family protein [Hungatella sp.]
MSAEYICPVLTAFKEDGSVDMEAMKALFDHLIHGGMDGIAIMGSSGEFYSMTLKEAGEFARASLDYLKGKIPVYIGTGRLTLEETVQLSSMALEWGAEGVMIVGPYYIGADKEGIYAYYDQVAGQVKGNMILYNYPDRTGYDITPDIVLRLLKKHKNIVGFKDTMPAPSHTRELIRSVKPLYPEFRIYSGFDDNFIHVLLSGGNGCIAALSNVRPELCAQWRDAWKKGDLKKVMAIQGIIDGLMDFYKISTPFMPAMKYALQKMGLPISAGCRLPALPASKEQRREVDRMLEESL